MVRQQKVSWLVLIKKMVDLNYSRKTPSGGTGFLASNLTSRKFLGHLTSYFNKAAQDSPSLARVVDDTCDSRVYILPFPPQAALEHKIGTIP